MQNNDKVPIWHKAMLTLKEASMYSGIGTDKLRELTNEPGNPIVFWCGKKRLLKRVRLEEYLQGHDSIDQYENVGEKE